MKGSQKNKPSETSILKGWSNLKKTIISVGTLGIIGLLADVLGLFSFLGSDEPKVVHQTNVTKPNNSVNTTVINNNSVNSTIVNNNTNFIDKSTYNCQITNQIIASNTQSKPEEKDNAKTGVIKAANYFCENNNELAYEYINKYEEPPLGINPVAFYTLKGNIVFFEKNYDLAYQYLLKAFYIDRKSPYLDLPKLRGLTSTYAQLLPYGYNLKNIKNIELLENKKLVFDLGFKKIEQESRGYSFIIVHKVPTTEEEELLKIIHELKMELPMNSPK